MDAYRERPGSPFELRYVRVEFEIKNTGHYWPSLPLAIPWNCTLKLRTEDGQLLDYVKGYRLYEDGYASLTERGRPIYVTTEIHLPQDFSGTITATVEIDPNHTLENADFMWRNNKEERTISIRIK